jgi:hypothetical protein
MYSLTIFGYNANPCEAIVAGLNLRVPMDVVSFSDTRVDILATALLRRHVYRANARTLTIGDDLHVYKMWATERVWQGRPRSLEPELASISCALSSSRRSPSRLNRCLSRGKKCSLCSSEPLITRATGACGVLISWVYREHGVVTAAMRAANYATHDEYLMATIKAKGQHFDTDSATVFKLLWKAVSKSETLSPT